jgi:hypothetical protein
MDAFGGVVPAVPERDESYGFALHCPRGGQLWLFDSTIDGSRPRQEAHVRMPQESIFVQVEDGRDGVAKLVGVEGKSAEVEYFASPAGPVVRRLRLPPATALSEVEL